ncbi:MAG TPA: hypothetical protein VFP95_01680 [Gammaproteobacteria bacterium]|nr:hypothetical protein [Gammaproteobacteria bacterium]
MSKKQSLKPLAIAVGAALAGSATMGLAQADTNPFGMSALSSGYEMPAGEGSCGAAKGEEGKCGEEKGAEGKCGEGKCGEHKGEEGKCGEGKCGEGKCGEEKGEEGKCGESVEK